MHQYYIIINTYFKFENTALDDTNKIYSENLTTRIGRKLKKKFEVLKKLFILQYTSVHIKIRGQRLQAIDNST